MRTNYTRLRDLHATMPTIAAITSHDIGGAATNTGVGIASGDRKTANP